MKIQKLFTISLLTLSLSPLASAGTVTLLSETFDGVGGFSNGRAYGAPSIANGADNDWRAARIERPDGGLVSQDVGVQSLGGSGNATPVGFIEDDAGLLISFDASQYREVTLSFDWRTFSASVGDELVVGYYVGDLTAGHPTGFSNDVIDLRPTSQGGPADGDWNWGTGWIELFRGSPQAAFSTEVFALTQADGASEVWLGFWYNGGENDFGKIDNIHVSAVPVPTAIWLMGSGLLALAGLRRRS